MIYNEDIQFKFQEKGYGKGFYDGQMNERRFWIDRIKNKIEEYEDYETSIYYGLRSNGKAFHQAVRMEVKEILQSLLDYDFPITITREKLENEYK